MAHGVTELVLAGVPETAVLIVDLAELMNEIVLLEDQLRLANGASG